MYQPSSGIVFTSVRAKYRMRPRINPGDYVFGVSPSGVGPRRIVFVGHIEERITFREAYERFPDLRGPEGPIHVRPISHSDLPAHCSYAHIPDAMHADRWQKDLASLDLDAFFVCSPQTGCVGRWLGRFGPKIDGEILDFLKTCSVHGEPGELSQANNAATLRNPIVHRGPLGGLLFRGLHLETSRPEVLLGLCETRMATSTERLDEVPVPMWHQARRHPCGSRKTSRGCR